MELTIGSLPEDIEEGAVAALKRIGVSDSFAWRLTTAPIATISLLNLASVCLFLDHVARLDGFTDSATALEHTRFRHLPWWQTSIWLPIIFEPPREPAMESGGWPVFLGNCQGLLADLCQVQRLSDARLGSTPDGYEQMRADYRAFLRSGFELNDERTVLQWVWRGLQDGAEIAVSNSAPLLGMD
jgi:hypothetical protein